MRKVLFVVSFPKKLHSSARFRVELYEKMLTDNGIFHQTEFFWDSKMYTTLYQPGHFIEKTFSLIKGMFRRVVLLFSLYKFDYIFVLREATPVAPPFFEWIASKILHKKLIYDFDDAIWIEQASATNPIVNFIRGNWKVGYICKWAYKVSVGNKYLYDFASKYSKNVVLNPTCVDTLSTHNILKTHENQSNKITIGWTGSFSTLVYLNGFLEILKELESIIEFEFLVIADQNPNLPLKNFRFIKWDADTEISDLLQCDIGVMPLIDDEFAKGKCGFKIIQYMSLGIPVVASPVGVNLQIVDNGTNGFLCNSKTDWLKALEKLSKDVEFRKQMGLSGRKKVEERYSELSNRSNFLSLFK